VILIDEEVKKESENERVQKGKPKEGNSELGFWYKNEVGYVLLHRWEVAFPEENIARWVSKVVQAVQLRKLMDNLLRYNYYVDNMPIDDINGLETQIQTEVLGRVSFPFDKAQIDPLMEEMNNAFTKLQNEVLFRKHLHQNGDAAKMFSKELKLDFLKKKTAPTFGRIQLKREKEVVALNLGKIIKHDAKSFDERFKAFGLASLYSIKEVISAMDAIKHECLELKTVEFFDTNFVSGYTKL
jgi:dynein heavy chain